MVVSMLMTLRYRLTLSQSFLVAIYVSQYGLFTGTSGRIKWAPLGLHALSDLPTNQAELMGDRRQLATQPCSSRAHHGYASRVDEVEEDQTDLTNRHQ